jgi:proteasome assembly chaperone 3
MTMPVPAALANGDTDGSDVISTPFPARTKQAAALVNGIKTDVMSVSFADKIIFTISQGGRLSQWVRSSLNLDLGI